MTARLDLRFERVAAENRAALLTFVMAGDPDAETSSAILAALPTAGADIVELGMPFSDPIADGPAIQGAGRRALEASEARLAAIEEKLRNFERELAEFRANSEREMEAERERLKQAAEREAERILDFARSQIEASGRAARLELKRYAAAEALQVAETLIRERLDDSARSGW